VRCATHKQERAGCAVTKDIDRGKGEVENLDGNVRSNGRKSRDIHRRKGSATPKRVAEMPRCVQRKR